VPRRCPRSGDFYQQKMEEIWGFYQEKYGTGIIMSLTHLVIPWPTLPLLNQHLTAWVNG